MRYTFLLLINILAFSHGGCKCECTAQNTTDMINDTILTDKFECLDIDKLKKIAEIYDPNHEFPSYSYEEYYDTGVLKLTIYGDQKYGFTQYMSLDTINYLSLYKDFYPDGRIKQKGIRCDLGFRVGKWYKFDEYVDLIEETDSQKDHSFTFAQLKEAVKKEGISLDNLPAKNGSNGLEYPIVVGCGISEINGNIPTWAVEYKDPDNSEDGLLGTEVMLTYDGRTGELIKVQRSALNP